MKLRFVVQLFILLGASFSQAQYVDQYGVTDYGLIQDVVVNGSEVPGEETQVRGVTVKLRILEVARDMVGMGGPIIMNTCTGTLIAPQVVLTAAHCLIENQEERGIAVYIEGRLFSVKDYVRHPRYEGFTYRYNWFQKIKILPKNDIALIFLSTKAEKIVPALLPPAGGRLKEGADVIMAGYGATGAGLRDGNGPLRWVTVKASETNESVIQINGAKTVCVGDSGGPGLIYHQKRFMVIGVSSTSDCKSVAHMTRVADYIPWIQGEIAKFSSRRDI